MEIEIKKLTPDLTEDYLHFFENDAHKDNKDEDRCYCVCWCSDDHRKGQNFSSPEKRRAYAVRYVGDGSIRGYLAYCGGKVVGWCNANDKAKCLNCISWLRFMAPVGAADLSPGAKVKSVFCFAIAPEMKRQGVATKLLARVCEDAENDGYEYLEAYPNKEFVSVFRDFMGPYGLYQKAGFTIHKELGQIFVVRKYLKARREPG